jgi:nicotinamidase-related amidase
MEKIAILIFILCLVISGNSRALQKDEPGKTGIRPALLVIDVQNAYLKGIPEHDRNVAFYYINHLLDLFHEHGWPVIRIYHSGGEITQATGGEEFEFPASVKTKPEDTQVIKTYPDAFNKTDLDQVLKAKGSNTLFLCGLSSIGCVLATWIGAFNHDYKAFLVKDAMMSHNLQYTDNIEMMFDAVGFDMVKMIVETAGK